MLYKSKVVQLHVTDDCLLLLYNTEDPVLFTMDGQLYFSTGVSEGRSAMYFITNGIVQFASMHDAMFLFDCF